MSAPALPRILCIMGSGETAPTMTSVHADLLSRMGPPPVPAVLLDTPFGFQENADDISARARTYFRENVGFPIEVASFRDRETATPLEYETMLARIAQARYVFAGPGSPTYAPPRRTTLGRIHDHKRIARSCSAKKCNPSRRKAMELFNSLMPARRSFGDVVVTMVSVASCL